MLPLQPRFSCVLTHFWSLNVIEGTSWNATRYAADEQRAWTPCPCSFTNATGYLLRRRTALILQIRPLVQFSTTVPKYASRGCISTNKRSRNPLPRLPLEVFYSWFSEVHGKLQPWAECYLKALIWIRTRNVMVNRINETASFLEASKKIKHIKGRLMSFY